LTQFARDTRRHSIAVVVNKAGFAQLTHTIAIQRRSHRFLLSRFAVCHRRALSLARLVVKLCQAIASIALRAKQGGNLRYNAMNTKPDRSNLHKIPGCSLCRRCMPKQSILDTYADVCTRQRP